MYMQQINFIEVGDVVCSLSTFSPYEMSVIGSFYVQ